MVAVKLFVEGGGGSHALRSACREGFSAFLRRAGFSGKMPRIIACGSRRSAYDDYCTALANGQPSLLLIDSEAPVAPAHQQHAHPGNWQPWLHLAPWSRPSGAADTDCHLMVQCMEAWLLADRQTLQSFFNPGFRSSALPNRSRPVSASRRNRQRTLFRSLKDATAGCKTRYDKGEHSFKMLALIYPAKVGSASGWAGSIHVQLLRNAVSFDVGSLIRQSRSAARWPRCARHRREGQGGR